MSQDEIHQDEIHEEKSLTPEQEDVFFESLQHLSVSKKLQALRIILNTVIPETLRLRIQRFRIELGRNRIIKLSDERLGIEKNENPYTNSKVIEKPTAEIEKTRPEERASSENNNNEADQTDGSTNENNWVSIRLLKVSVINGIKFPKDILIQVSPTDGVTLVTSKHAVYEDLTDQEGVLIDARRTEESANKNGSNKTGEAIEETSDAIEETSDAIEETSDAIEETSDAIELVETSDSSNQLTEEDSPNADKQINAEEIEK